MPQGCGWNPHQIMRVRNEMMKKVLLALFLFAVPAAAQAETLQPVPVPAEEVRVDGYRVLAIAAGAVGGVVAANAATGGLITPWLTAGTANGGATAGGSLLVTTAARSAVTAVGAVGGGFIGNWLYGK